jgi:hypothetical protein
VVAFKLVKIIVFLAERISIKISGSMNGRFIDSLKEYRTANGSKLLLRPSKSLFILFKASLNSEKIPICIGIAQKSFLNLKSFKLFSGYLKLNGIPINIFFGIFPSLAFLLSP